MLAPDAELALPPQLYLSYGPSSCVRAKLPAGYKVYASHPLAADTFVGAREATDPRGTRVGARVLLAEDGAAEVFGYFDESLQAPCDVIVESIGWRSDLCIPTTMSWANDWSDPSCTEVAAHIGRGCPTPTIAVDAIDDACYANPKILAYTIGASLSSAYSASGTDCDAITGDDREDYYVAEEKIDPTTIPAVSVLPIGSSSLQVYFRASPEGVPILPAGLGVLPNSSGAFFRDGARHTDCTATQLADQSWRCLPSDGLQFTGAPYFSDAACTQEVIDAGGSSASCPAPAPTVAIRLRNLNCSLESRVEGISGLGPPLDDGAALCAKSDSGSCAPAPFPAGERLYPLAAPIDAASFPLLTERTE